MELLNTLQSTELASPQYGAVMKEALESHLRAQWEGLFAVKYDLLRGAA